MIVKFEECMSCDSQYQHNDSKYKMAYETVFKQNTFNRNNHNSNKTV